MKSQAHSSSELTLEYSQDQMPLRHPRLVLTFLINLVVLGIFNIFTLVLEGKAGKDTRVIKIRSDRKVCQMLKKKETSAPLNKEGIADLPVLRTLSVIRKYHSKFRGNDKLFCFISVIKFDSFKNPFATITSLPELCFRWRRFIFSCHTWTASSECWSLISQEHQHPIHLFDKRGCYFIECSVVGWYSFKVKFSSPSLRNIIALELNASFFKAALK